MPNLKEIKQRIDSVKSTRQITSAMKLVSAAKLQKAQQRILNARPYSDELDEILLSLATRTQREVHPLLRKVEPENVKTIAIVVVTADKGLCGAFNMNIIKKSEMVIKRYSNKNVELICVGKKGRNYFKNKGFKIREEYIDFFNKLKFDHSRDVMNIVSSYFLQGRYDKVVIVYNEFKSAIQQDVGEKQLLPLEDLEEPQDKFLSSFLFEPGPYKLLEELIKKHLDVQIWRVLLESSSAEQGARMTAMDAATDNADEMLKDLTLEYHHKRQDKITKEIIEVASTAEGMK
ncbi:MAG: ATP synthase F1 subunit gamma [Candidatus Cloacimonadota bacterium]|nr:ATP synthase F1 subunit gamma [Candidatus Cloacimonadota bacterium]